VKTAAPIYELIIDQGIKGDDSQIWWELFWDPDHGRAKVDGRSSSLEIGSTQGFVMRMTVDYPTSKEESKIRFTLTNRKDPSQKKETPWYVGNDKGWGTRGMFHYCGISEKWHNDKGTWRRKIQCRFGPSFENAISDTTGWKAPDCLMTGCK
jgi:hypothetical protein